MSDRVPSSPPSAAQDIPGMGARSPPAGKEEKQLFSISNSERQNQGFLKGFYSMKNRGSVSSGTGTSVPSGGIVSPRGGSGADTPSSEINFGPTQTSPVRRDTPSPNATSPNNSRSSTPKPPSPPPQAALQPMAQPEPKALVEKPVVTPVSPVQRPESSATPPPRTETPPPAVFSDSKLTTPPPRSDSSTTTSPQPSTGSSSAATPLEDRLRALEAENQLLKQGDVGQIKQQLLERENEIKKAMAELTASTESKKRSFTLIVASKDDEIAKLRREAQQATTKRTQELEEKLALREKELTDLKTQRDREVLELQQKLSDKELEVLELRERELSAKSKQDQQNQEALMVRARLEVPVDSCFYPASFDYRLRLRSREKQKSCLERSRTGFSSR